MNFYDWMMNKYADKNNARGDLAGDMKRSKDFPKNGDRDAVLGYLENKGACDECIAVFKRCWRDYQKEIGACKNRRLKNIW